MSGRHRHAVNVRTDGLAAVLGPLATDPRVRAAALVDVDSGMVLDSCGPDTSDGPPDTETRGAAHAELVRIAMALASGPDDCEIVVQAADGSRHVLQPVADPHGGRLALAVVVDGSAWVLSRLRRRLRAVSDASLTAGPSTALRPTADGWQPGRLRPRDPAPALPQPPSPGTTTMEPSTRPGHEPLWVPADHLPDADGSRLPAMAGLPEESSGSLPRRLPGSTWTSPPAPATAGDVDVDASDDATDDDVTPVSGLAGLLPGPRRPAPPSALPPAVVRPGESPGEDRVSRPGAGTA